MISTIGQSSTKIDKRKGGAVMTDRELLEKIANRMDNFETKLDGLKAEIGGVRQELKATKQELRDEIGGVKQELKATKQELRDEIGEVKLVLENEIRNNISIIAEGHLDLARQFNDVIKAGMRVVNIEVRTNVLETKVRQIAKQIKVS